MKYSGLAVQSALYTALNNKVVLNIGGSDYTLPVVSHTDEDIFQNGPFIFIGTDQGSPDFDAGNRGQRRDVSVSVWARGSQGRSLTKEVAFKLIDILDQTNEPPCSLEINGFTIHAIEWTGDSSLPVDDDGETYNTDIDFSIQLSED